MPPDAGDRVEFIQIAVGRYEFVAATHSIQDLTEMFGRPNKSTSIDDMDKAIARRWATAR